MLHLHEDVDEGSQSTKVLVILSALLRGETYSRNWNKYSCLRYST